MTRLFYDCPIKAAYMAKEFGVKFEEDESVKRMIANGFEGVKETDWRRPDAYIDLKGNWIKTKKYVASELENIFEPKEGDSDGYYLEWEEGRWFSREYGEPRDYEKPEICMRDGKHFFSPLKETSD